MRFEEALLLAGKGQLITGPDTAFLLRRFGKGRPCMGILSEKPALPMCARMFLRTKTRALRIGSSSPVSSPMHGKAAMCRMGKTVRAGVPRCPRFPLANRESGTIGNLDALSFLNGATVGYDESRVPAGTSGGRESAGRGTVSKMHVKGPEGISPGLLHAPGCGKAGC